MIENYCVSGPGAEVGLKCDLCGSIDIKESREGYACGDCGLVLDIQKLEYYRPYNDDVVQYAVLGRTQLGFKRERMHHSKSMRLEGLNKLHGITVRNNEDAMLSVAKAEISRIFGKLSLPPSYKDLVFKKFKALRGALKPGTKYRSPEKLIPLTIYMCSKMQGIVINEGDLLCVSKITKKEFNSFKLQIHGIDQEYASRKKVDYVLQLIMNVTEHFNLGMSFFYQSKKILYKLWGAINCTKDSVIAGLVSSISVLCSFRDKANVNGICKLLDIKMSTIQAQVKKNVVSKLNVEGFTSLVKSSDLLRQVFVKLGVVEGGQELSQDDVLESNEVEVVKTVPEKAINEPRADFVEIELGNAVQVFNHHDNIDYYFFAFKALNDNTTVVSLKTYDMDDWLGYSSKESSNSLLFEVDLVGFLTGKGPPHLLTG